MNRHPGASIITHRGKCPQIHESAFIAPGARIVGDVVVGPDASVWYNCVLRGDINRIVVGARSNVQDGTVIHVEGGGAQDLPTLIGNDALIGHMALLHGCVVEQGAFVGMGAIMMDGSRLESRAMLAAGALLPPGKSVPAEELWGGRPARPMRLLTGEQLAAMADQTAHYVATARDHRASVAASID